MKLHDYLSQYANKINKEIQQLLNIWNFPDPLNKAIRYLLESGGKRIRPTLTLLSCECVGGKSSSVMNSAIAIELIHNASLLWDDVIDADELRRGRITVHKKWDKNIALLAGGMLASKALELIANQPNVFELYSKTIGKMIEGQVLDITNSLHATPDLFESRSEREIFELLRNRFRKRALESLEWNESGDLVLIAQFSEFEEERDYFEMISYKTSALIKLATKIGAILGGGTQEEIQALANYGFYLGLAFQVRDDLIGIISNEKILGKPIGTDIRQGKLNLYLIFALRNLTNHKLNDFLKLMQNIDAPGALQDIKEILNDCGALNYAEEKLKFIAQNAKNELNALQDSESKDILNELITFTIERNF